MWHVKKKDKVEREVQLMVFLKPKVVRTPDQARQLLEEIDRKTPTIKRWREEPMPPPGSPLPPEVPEG